MSGIFISYRREDTAGYAGRLSDRLRDSFGKNQVFMDIETIEPGVDFVEVLTRAVGSCKVLIAVIGKIWLTVTDAEGKRRLDDPEDFTRIEIKTALERGIRVIPLLIEDVRMPVPEQLPDDLKTLARRQSLQISNSRWADDIKRLIDVLEKELGVTVKTPAPPRPSMKKAVIGTVSLTLVSLTAYFVISHKQTTPPPVPVVVTPKSAETKSQPPPKKSLSRPELPAKIVPAGPSHPPERVQPEPAKISRLSAKANGDGTTLVLKNSSGEERKFIPLGQDRIQRIYNSSNGNWCLVVCKVRGQSQYFAFAVDLLSGDEQKTLDIPAMPENVAFEKSDVVMNFGNGDSKRFALRQ